MVLAIGGALSCTSESLPAAAEAPHADAGVLPDAGAGRPAKPSSWTCAPGWAPRPQLVGTDDAFTSCEPPSAPEACPIGTMPALGEATCVSVGGACPSGEWPEGLPLANTLFVKPGGSGDGTSASSPLGTIQAALDRAAPGTTVALARGEYPESVRIASSVTLVGACAAAVTLGRVGGERVPGPGVVVESTGSATLANLGIRRFTGAGLAGDQGSTVVLRGVDFAENEDRAIVGGGTLAVDGCHVHGTVAGGRTDSGGLMSVFALRGSGIEFAGQSLVVRGSTIEGNMGHGLFAAGDLVEVGDTVIRDHVGSPLSEASFASVVVPRRTVSFERVLFERNRTIGLLLWSGALTSRVSLKDLVVRDTDVNPSTGLAGFGLVVVSRGVVSLENALFVRNHSVGIATELPSLDLALTNVVVDDTRGVDSGSASAAPALSGGIGISISKGVHATAANVVIERAETAGVVVQGSNARLRGADLVVTNVAPNRGTRALGVGVGVSEGANLALRSARIVRATAAGIMVSRGASATLEWVDVEASRAGTLPAGVTAGTGAGGAQAGSDEPPGDGSVSGVADGVLVVGNSNASLSRVRASGCVRAGVLYSASTGSIAATTSTQNRFGLVLQGERAPTADFATCSFVENSEEAIVSSGALVVSDAPVPVPSSGPAP